MLHQCCIMSPPAHPPSCHLACFLMAVLPTVGTRLSRFRKTHLDPLQSLLSSDHVRPRGEIVTWQAIAAASSTSRCLNASAKRSIPRGEFSPNSSRDWGGWTNQQITSFTKVSTKVLEGSRIPPKGKDNSTLCTDIAVEFLDVCFPSNLFQGIVHKKASVLTVVFFFQQQFWRQQKKKHTHPKKYASFWAMLKNWLIQSRSQLFAAFIKIGPCRRPPKYPSLDLLCRWQPSRTCHPNCSASVTINPRHLTSRSILMGLWVHKTCGSLNLVLSENW